MNNGSIVKGVAPRFKLLSVGFVSSLIGSMALAQNAADTQPKLASLEQITTNTPSLTSTSANSRQPVVNLGNTVVIGRQDSRAGLTATF